MGSWSSDSARLARLNWQRWVGLGVLLALVWGMRGACSSLCSGPPMGGDRAQFWISDRGAGEVLGLTSEGMHCALIPARYPLELEPGERGRLWLLYAVEPGPDAARRLASLAHDGELRFDLPAPGLHSLRADLKGAVVGLNDAGVSGRSDMQVVRFTEFGALTLLGSARRGAQLAVGSAGELWLASAGRIAVLDPEGSSWRTVRSVALDHEITQLVSRASRVWALESSPEAGRQLLGFDTAGALLLELPVADLDLGSDSLWLAAASDGGVWVVSERGEALSLDSRGVPLARGELPLLGIEAVRATDDGGIACVCAGALMRLDRHASRLPGQGGFRFACDLVVRRGD